MFEIGPRDVGMPRRVRRAVFERGMVLLVAVTLVVTWWQRFA